MNTYLLSLQRCGHIIAFFPLNFDRDTLKIVFIESGTNQLVLYVQVKCPIRRPISHFVNSHVNTTKTIFSTGRKFVAYSWFVSYSLFITYSLFAIPYFIRWISIKLGEYINNFKVRGQEHGDILSFYIQPSGHNIYNFFLICFDQTWLEH